MSHSTRARLTPCHPGRTDFPMSNGVSETAQKPILITDPSYPYIFKYYTSNENHVKSMIDTRELTLKYYLKLKLILKNVLLVLKYYIYNLIVVKNV